MTARIVLAGRAEDAAAAVARAAELARGGAQVTPWLAPGGPDADDPLLAAAAAAADRVEQLPPGDAPAWRVSDDDDPRRGRQALLICRRMLELQPGQRLLADGADVALPLLDRVARLARELGAQASVRVAVDGMERALLDATPVEVLAEPDAVALAVHDALQATVRVQGDRRADALAGVDPARLQARTRGADPVRRVRFERTAAGTLRWALTACPAPSLAAHAGMGEREYADLLYAAAGCDDPDPVGLWERRAAVQERLKERLEAGHELHVVGPGTDVVLGIGGRRWRSSAANRNLPDGEVFSGPVEDSAQGVATFGVPTVRTGRRVAGVRLRFEAGVIVDASAEEGEDVLLAALDVDEGARRLGEVGIGTNYGLPRATASILLDEKIGGTFHLAFGAGYPETGSTNRSAEHWDLIGDLRGGGEIRLDGQPLQRDGRFLQGLQDGL